MSKMTRNVFSLILAPENRTLLVGFIVLLLTVVGVTAFIVNQTKTDEPQGSASVKSGSVKVGASSVATGKESAEYLKTVKEYNDNTLETLREENPSAHPLPIHDGLAKNSCQANHDAWSNCLRATGILEEGDCATTDSQCMIDNGLIEEGECAPSDMVCRKMLGLNKDGYCDPSNYSCIAERAKEVDCNVSDTDCLRKAGIITEDSCAPGDDSCEGTRFSFCNITDIDCIEKRALKFGCDLSDSKCLRQNGIIADTACGPEDLECLADPDYSFCNPSDLACIIKKARKAGCEIDDTACLRAAGIISHVACAPTDESCLGPKHGFCDTNDLVCISSGAKLVGCDLGDSACLRKHGVIAPTACSPNDSSCISKDEFCEPNDLACLVQASNLTGCKVNDSECLIAAGVLRPGNCAIGDPDCGSNNNRNTLCDAGDTECMATAASKAGCSLSDTKCLRENNIIGDSDCAPADSKCLNRRVAPEGALRGGSSRDQKYYRAAEGRGSRGKTINEEKHNDPEYMSQLLKLVSDKVPSRRSVEMGFSTKHDNKSETNDDSRTAQTSATQQSIGSSSEKVEEEEKIVLAKAGDVFYGITDIALSTDYEGPVSVTLLQPGSLNGAKALGVMVQVQNRVRLEINRVIKKNGQRLNVNAVALDPATTYAAVASRVDHHYLYRFGWWGFGTVLSAIGNATALGAKETIIIEDGGVAESNDLDSSGEAKVALGELGEDLGEAMKANMERPITVMVDANEELGIFFLDTVYDEAAE